MKTPSLLRSALLVSSICALSSNSVWADWTEQAQLSPNDNAPGNAFGQSVSVQNNLAVIGCPSENDGTGAAYVFARSAGVWKQQAKLVASDAETGSSFGISVALSDSTVLVGSYGWGGNGTFTGAAYVFVWNGSAWKQQSEFNGHPATGFGVSVALSGDTALVGAWGIGDTTQQAGAAYVYSRNGTTWSEQATLTPSNSSAYDQFGSKVALSGGTALIGAPGSGSAYVFSLSGTSWPQQAILNAPGDSTSTEFGYAIALQEDTALVGAYYTESRGQLLGAVYAFSRTGTTWTLSAGFEFPSNSPIYACGQSLALSGNIAVTGCNSETDADGVYVFERSGSSWTLKAVLIPPNGGAYDFFGVTGVALSGTTAIIGEPWFDPTATPGAAYVFIAGGA